MRRMGRRTTVGKQSTLLRKNSLSPNRKQITAINWRRNKSQTFGKGSPLRMNWPRSTKVQPKSCASTVPAKITWLHNAQLGFKLCNREHSVFWLKVDARRPGDKASGELLGVLQADDSWGEGDAQDLGVSLLLLGGVRTLKASHLLLQAGGQPIRPDILMLTRTIHLKHLP